MSSVTEVSKLLKLDFTDIPKSKERAARKEVSDFVINSILREVGNGKSPVEGEKFRKLTKPYAKKEHGGRRLPILELEGDMLEALEVKTTGKPNEIEIGIFGSSQAPKADGHNQLSREAKNWAAATKRVKYKRRFIPSKKQDFNEKITNGIDEILASHKDARKKERQERSEDLDEIDVSVETPEAIEVGTSDIFSDEVIENLLLQELKRQGRL